MKLIFRTWLIKVKQEATAFFHDFLLLIAEPHCKTNRLL